MSHKWEKTHDEEAYALRVEDDVKAVVFFIGGHVERPNTWYAKLINEKDSVAFATFADAKRYVEEELGLRDIVSATTPGPTQVINQILGERGPLSLPELVKACRPLPEGVVRSDAQRMLEAGALVLGRDMRVSPSEKGDPQDEIVMYLVARKDLKMSPGKLAAQVGHGVQFLSKLVRIEAFKSDTLAWFETWDSNKSSTKIVLEVKSLQELIDLNTRVPLISVMVKDEGRTEIESTFTVLAFAPTPKSIAREWLGHLPLYR